MAANGKTISSSPSSKVLGEPTVVVQHVSLEYRLKVKVDGDKRRFFSPNRKRLVRAIDDVSFVARSGESIGLIGSNGAGKSSVLRAIAGVIKPTSGTIIARSQPQLQAVGAALIPTLSGSENIRLGCLARGMTPKEVVEASKYVKELAGIGEAIDRPMRTYSAGMRSRLIFSINAAAAPDILLIDEALGTGDAAFTAKAEKTMGKILDESGTVLLVSHVRKTVERICSRAIWMHHGRVVADGPTDKIMPLYVRWSRARADEKTDVAERLLKRAAGVSNFREIKIDSSSNV